MDTTLLVLLGLAAGAWILLGPILVIVLWIKMRQLEGDVQRLMAARKLRGEAFAPTGVPGAVPTAVKPQLHKHAPEPVAGAGLWLEEPAASPPGPKVTPALEPANLPGEPAATGGPAKQPVAREAFSLEEVLAGKWMTWVGALAVIIGAGYALKYAIDNDYLGPTGRVVLGIVVGMACFAGGAIATLRNYRFLGQGLVGAASGILYLSLYFAYDFKLVPQEAAFVGTILVTIAGLAYSAIFYAQPTAILGLLGGFLSPLMLSAGGDERWVLFPYIFVLDLGVLGIAGFRKWQPLQILSFVCTLLLWMGWFGQYYAPEKFSDALILLTPFFFLFALLGVFHNVLRKKPADSGDFFLILATPVAYFAALYGITSHDYKDWQGLMAIVMAAVYLGFAVLAFQRHPQGKMTLLALGGIAASFLTLAVPLQLTGHWIAIAWAAEAVLLVELGLRFDLVKLRRAGFGLLGVVQLILVYYTLGTIADPVRFETRFTRGTNDPVVQGTVSFPQLSLPGRAAADQPEPPSWTNVFNGRSFSFLASALAMGILAWEYRRRSAYRSTVAGIGPVTEIAAPLSNKPGLWNSFSNTAWLMAGVPFSVLALLIVETFAFGHGRHWLFPTFVGLFTVWTALSALVLVVAGSLWGPRSLQRFGLAAFGLLALFVLIGLLGTIGGWSSEWTSFTAREQGASDSIWAWALVNPRGLGFVVAIAAAAVAAVFCQDGGETPVAGMTMSALMGVFAHLTGLALITSEVYAQGIIRQWHTGTSLGVTLAWTLYAIATLIAGIYYRAATVRILALSLFALTTGKVFLFDVWQLSTVIRTFAFVALGASLLLVSFLYRRFRDRIRAWITTTSILVAATLVLGDSPVQAAGETDPKIPIARLSHRWPITSDPVLAHAADGGARQKLVRLTLPSEVYGLARPDFADLRVFVTPLQGTAPREIPFLLVQPRDSSVVVERTAPLLNLSEVGGKTQFLLDLGANVEPVNHLTIQIADEDRNYDRAVTVWGADRRDAEEWNVLSREGYLLDRTGAGRRLTVSMIDFPQSRFHFYKIDIDNRGQPPLHVTGARLFDRIDVHAGRRQFPSQIVSQDQDPKEKQTRVIFDLAHDRLPSVGLVIDVSFDGNYYRPVTLDTADELSDKPRWRSIASGQLYRVDREGLNAIRRELDYPESAGRYLRLTISNGDDRPLNVAGATALSIDRSLVAESNYFADPDQPAALYAGNARLEAPTYDLARTAGTVALESLPTLTIGIQEANPLFNGSPDPGLPWSERNKPILWLLVIGGVVIFGSLTVLVLKKAAQSPGGPPS